MSKSRSGASRRVAAGLLAGALTVLGVALAPPAGATEDVTSERVAGGTRYGTAAAAAAEAYPDGNDAVVIATGEDFADSLAANGLAGAQGAALLLTQEDTLTEDTAAAIEVLGATTATIVGGTAAVSEDVEQALEDLGLTVDRVAGDTRYETAGEIAAAIGTYDTAIVASGEVSADALAAGPIAYALGAPILLTTTDDLPQATEDALAGVSEVLIAGGTARISDDTEAAIEAASGDTDAERLAGQNRQETAVEIADYAIANLGWGPAGVIIAAPNAPVSTAAKDHCVVGCDFSADALSLGQVGGVLNFPILIAESNSSLGATLTDFLTLHADTIALILIGGGPAALSEDLDAEATTAATTEETTNQTLVVPSDKQTLEQRATAAGGVTRTCIVSGITPGTTVDAMLLPTENVTDTDGIITFEDNSGTANQADEDPDPAAVGFTEDEVFARIVNVNGTNTTASTNVNDIVSALGAISVTIFSASELPADDVTLVVFADTFGGTDNDELDLVVPATANALPKQPSEAFGAGCRTVFVPAEFAGGAFGPADVSSLDKDLNYFAVTDTVAGLPAVAATFYYDENDSFSINGVPQAAGATGMAAFEAALSRGDTLTGTTYAPDPAATSVFALSDTNPVQPVIAAAVISPTSVGIDITPSSTLTDSYRVLRCSGAACTNFVQVGEVATTALAAGNDFVDTGLTTGVLYRYVARAVLDGDESGNSNVAEATPTTAAADVTGPTSTGIVTTTNAGLATTLDTGDVFKVVFNEPMSAPANGDLLRVRDGDAPTNSIGDIVCGTNATCALNAAAETVNGVARAANTVLTVTMTAEPTVVVIGSVPGIQYPATVIDQAGNTDLAGNQWNVGGSPDVTINGAFGA